ncbi:hypothetical protein B0T10DRAFT_161065 [Thelonectria olida]|uniref:LEA domain protein n=1 Tax=Thelonectria olida TaxID=1576542 RepID=A0A9P8WDP5_9HYPO|nr:hypothetical protein B0T10DRAFT_161065 [Thelonectria olida]
MPSTPPTPTPDETPTHTTYEVDVPVRPRRSSSSASDAEEPQPQPQIRIPKITPLSSGPSPQSLAKDLDGKYVDEFGNILDWDGTVLGRVDGDLPSMVGRPVETSGEVLDVDGQVVGHVSENYTLPNLKPLSGGLQVDDDGNIYDDQGSVVGKMNSPPKTKGEDKDKEESEAKGKETTKDVPRAPAAPRPDELYLDVKSTFDGIQLVIKIPTVFNRDRDSGK